MAKKTETPSTDTADTADVPTDTTDTETVPTFTPNTDMSVDGIKANIASIVNIDKHLSAVAGTVVAKGKAATLSVELAATELAGKIAPSDTAVDTLVSVYNIADALADIHPLIGVGFIDDIMSDLSDRRADYGSRADTMVRDILKDTSATSDTTTSLIAQRSAIVGLVSAMSNVLDQMGTTVKVSVTDDKGIVTETDMPVSKALSVPTAPKIPGVSSVSTVSHGSAPTVSVRNGSFYVIKNGNRHHYSNDSLSYLAYKFGVDIDSLSKMLSDKNIDQTKTFETSLTVTGVKSPQAGKTNTWTFGLVVTDKADTPAAK